MTLAQFNPNLPQKVEGSNHLPPKDPQARAMTSGPIPHLSADDIDHLEHVIIGLSKKRGQEYGLFIRTTFDTALRVNEVLGIRPMDVDVENGPVVQVDREKGGYPPYCAISPSVATRLLSFAYRSQIPQEARFFTFNGRYAHRLVQRAGEAAGIRKPANVGWVHLLRHSGAIERLRVTRHLPGIQAQLGHRSPLMTLRYLKTLTMEEALEASQIGVEVS